MKTMSDINTILVHDWLNGMRGGERVLEILCDMFPDAPIYTLFYEPSKVSAKIARHNIVTSKLNRIAFARNNHRLFLPFLPKTIESFQLPQADLIISTSHCVAKGIVPPEGSKHLCYSFTPMRYAWGFYHEYFGRNPLKKMILKPILKQMRVWDKNSSVRVDQFVTLSKHVRRRINDFYEREAEIVYPPVATTKWTPAP
ncbi:MAG: glycosyltransferase family 4 protein, partial [Lentisphaerae bacterium]|nr:glycosyltransferase family 4 protein [Lentisphaerota bacterium]